MTEKRKPPTLEATITPEIARVLDWIEANPYTYDRAMVFGYTIGDTADTDQSHPPIDLPDRKEPGWKMEEEAAREAAKGFLGEGAIRDLGDTIIAIVAASACSYGPETWFLLQALSMRLVSTIEDARLANADNEYVEFFGGISKAFIDLSLRLSAAVTSEIADPRTDEQALTDWPDFHAKVLAIVNQTD